MKLLLFVGAIGASSLAIAIASPAAAAAIFQVESNPGGTALNLTGAGGVTSTFGTLLSPNDVTVTTNVASDFSSGVATITPASGLLTSITFTPANPTAFNDFAFRGQDLLANQTIDVIVTDQNGVSQTIPFTEITANADFASNGIVGLPGEAIASVELVNSGGFKEGKQFEFSSANDIVVGGVPEPGTWSLLIGGFFGLGATLRRARRNGAPIAA